MASQTQSPPSRQSQKFGANSRFYGTNIELSQGNEGKIHEMELKNVDQSLIVPKPILDFRCISARSTNLLSIWRPNGILAILQQNPYFMKACTMRQPPRLV